MLIFFPALILVFWNSKPKSIFGQFWVKNVELSTLPGSWHTEYFEDITTRMPGKVWKQRQKWMLVLSACCSYIFIIAKGKNCSNQRKNVVYVRL